MIGSLQIVHEFHNLLFCFLETGYISKTNTLALANERINQGKLGSGQARLQNVVINIGIGLNSKIIGKSLEAFLLTIASVKPVAFIPLLFENKDNKTPPVSYTHLTLPTIYSV